MASKRKENPQKELSKEWIIHALLSMMHDIPYRNISISALSDKAGLNRSTFYRHFTTTDDVIIYYLNKLCNELVKRLPEISEMSLPKFVFIYFSFWEDYKDFLSLLKENQMLHLLLQQFMPRMGDELLGERVNLYVYYFIAGGVWNLLEKWLEDGANLSAKELEDEARVIANELAGGSRIR